MNTNDANDFTNTLQAADKLHLTGQEECRTNLPETKSHELTSPRTFKVQISTLTLYKYDWLTVPVPSYLAGLVFGIPHAVRVGDLPWTTFWIVSFLPGKFTLMGGVVFLLVALIHQSLDHKSTIKFKTIGLALAASFIVPYIVLFILDFQILRAWCFVPGRNPLLFDFVTMEIPSGGIPGFVGGITACLTTLLCRRLVKRNQILQLNKADQIGQIHYSPTDYP